MADDRSTPKAFPASPVTDPLGKVIEALGFLDDSIKENNRQVKAVGSTAETTRRSVQELRKEQALLTGRVANVETNLEKIDARVGSSERQMKRHDSGFRQLSDTDSKIQSDQAAMVIATEEARRYAKDALAVSNQALAKVDEIAKTANATRNETEAQTPVLAQIQLDQKKSPIGTIAASVLALSATLLQIILEVLRRLGK